MSPVPKIGLESHLPPWPQSSEEARQWLTNPEAVQIYSGFYSRHDSVRGKLNAVGVLGSGSGIVICIGYHGPKEGQWNPIPMLEFLRPIKTDKYDGPNYILNELAPSEAVLKTLRLRR